MTKPKQYALVYSQGDTWACDLLVMRALPNGLTFSRCGFSISKRVGKAVVRNKIKRRLRHIMRGTLLRPGWDIVIIARPVSANADYASLNKAITDLLSRAHLLETSGVAL